jgi:HPt (histidine-containing phosphotransfer) domain-containing protein
MLQYLGRREIDLRTLRDALEEGDFECIRIKGHNLFGSGSAYGLDRISELGARIENAAKQENREQINKLIDALAAYIGNLRVV